MTDYNAEERETDNLLDAVVVSLGRRANRVTIYPIVITLWVGILVAALAIAVARSLRELRPW